MQSNLSHSIQRLEPLGRWLYDHSVEALWERDTRTLPRYLRQRRRAYRRFAQERIAPLALEADRSPEVYDPRPLLAEAGRRGFQSELLPWPLGRMPYRALLDGKVFAVILKAEEFCAACGGIGLSLLAHDLGMGPLLLAGHLPTILRWQWPINRANLRGDVRLVVYAITEPGAGSDMEESAGAARARYTTTARKVNGGYVLNGQKVFISGGAHCDYATVFAVLEREDGSPARVDTDYTCFIVERGREGFRAGRRERKLGQRACDASQLFLDDVFVPARNLVGTERSGWALNRNVLNYSRGPVGAIALGIARGAAESATRFARETRLNNKPLVAYQEVQLALAEMWIDVLAMRGLVWQSARHFLPQQGMAAASKAFCGELGFRVANRAMELMGDHGYLADQGAEKAMRDVRLNQIYEGTNQINYLAFVESFWESDLGPGDPARG
ncbi:MAG: acyl-CoA/acyl-ACP dehydrogenase [Anaerolineae bacterium]|nr:acyl-CoA/acyl-ACP dehydrogenase [Anaerolineae bacterium]